MNYRELGKTGINVSEIGFGTWGLGGDAYGTIDVKEAASALDLSIDKGVNFFDTSDLYGTGVSENLLGNVCKKFRDKVIIATKGGTLPHSGFEMPQDFSESHLRGALEKSLRRLMTDYVDIYQLHSPKLIDLDESTAIRTLQDFKQEGKIKEYGVSVRSPDDGITAVKKHGVPIIQVNYNMIDQRGDQNGLFDLARDRGVGIICRTPLVFGYLTGIYSGLEELEGKDHRNNWPKDQLLKWANAPEIFKRKDLYKGRTPVQLALQFCLANDAISTVIPGMLNIQHVEENLVATDLEPLTRDELNIIRQLYRDHDFYRTTAKDL